MLLFPIKFPNKKRKRVKHDAPAPSGPPALEVLSVQRETDNTCIWTYSRTIAEANDPAGFIAAGDISAAINWVEGNQMSLWYADPISVGDAWSVDPTEITTVFDPPGTIEPQSGLIG